MTHDQAEALRDDWTEIWLEPKCAENGDGRLWSSDKPERCDDCDLEPVKYIRADPVGPENDAYLEQIMRQADIHIVAWGPLAKLPPRLRTRWRDVVAIADRVGCRLMCWGTAQDGHPRHPLMLAYSTPLIEWSRPR